MAKRKTSASKKRSKPSAKQLAARKKFAAAAKARSKKSRKSSAKRPVLKVDKKPIEGLYGMALKKRKDLKPRKSGRKMPSGPESRADDVSRITLRTPTLILEPLKDTIWEAAEGGWSRLGW